MPHSQALFVIALITIITARVIEWLLLMRTCRLRAAAVPVAVSQDGDAPTPVSAEAAPRSDRLSQVLLVLAWLGALGPPILIAAGIWMRRFQE